MRHQKVKRKEKIGWKTESGILVKPDKDGKWPAVMVTFDQNGKKQTIVAGAPGLKNQDAV